MNKQRPLILIFLVLYAFAPMLFQWAIDTSSQWYRPFIIWFLVVAVAFLIQLRGKANDL